MGVSRPALAQNLKAPEKQLGVKLRHRSERPGPMHDAVDGPIAMLDGHIIIQSKVSRLVRRRKLTHLEIEVRRYQNRLHVRVKDPDNLEPTVPLVKPSRAWHLLLLKL
jgi:hypothetical protein